MGNNRSAIREQFRQKKIISKTVLQDNEMKLSVVKSILILLLFVLLGLGIYSNTLETPFYFDDQADIVENSHIRITNLTFNAIKSAGFESRNSSRPIANMSYALNYYVHQYKLKGYHIVNIIIHVLTGILLYLFIKTTLSIQISTSSHTLIPESLNPTFIAVFAALVWLVNPVHTQSVTYIVQRDNSMAAMFYVLSFWLYVMGRLAIRNGKRWPLYGGSALAWIMALGSKENAASLPFFIFLYEWYFFQNLDRDWLKRNMKIVFGVIMLFVLTALIFLGTSPLDKLKSITDFANHEFTLTERILTQPRVVIYYLSLIFFPHPSRLNLDYDFPLSHSLFDPVTTLLAMGAIIGLIGLAVYTTKRERLISFCILWFFGNLVIESSVIPLAIIYEHRTYLPSMLVCLLAVLLVGRYIRPKWAGIALMCTVITVFSFWTYQRNILWNDPIALWTDCVEKSPRKARPHYNLGSALSDQGRTTEAIRQYAEVLRIKPDSSTAHLNIANDLDKQGRTEEAINHYEQVLKIYPDSEKAHNNLGNVLNKQGRTEEAIHHYLQALRIKPDFEDAHNNLGNALLKQGKVGDAIKHFNAALQINPLLMEAHNSLGTALFRAGNIDEAIAHFRKALQIDPDFAKTHVNLGGALVQTGKIDEAIVHFRKALKINPDIAEAYINLGVAWANTGKVEEAISCFRKALQIDPDNAEALDNLSKTMAALEKIDREISNIQAELMLAPEDPKLNYNLGNLYKMKGQLDRAEDYYQKAISLQPEFPEALYELAKLHIKRREYEKALALYHKMIAFLPDNPAVYYNVACIYAKQNNPGESIAWLQKAVDKGFNDWEHIKTDVDLDNIRDSDPYKAFIEGR